MLLDFSMALGDVRQENLLKQTEAHYLKFIRYRVISDFGPVLVILCQWNFLVMQRTEAISHKEDIWTHINLKGSQDNIPSRLGRYSKNCSPNVGLFPTKKGF